MIMIVAMPFTGIISINEALAGFSDSNIVLIAALFVIGEGLVRTGVARRLGDWLNASAGTSQTRLLVLLMIVVGGLGALMSSTAVVAIFIPVVLRICGNTGTPPSRLMMPLSVAALVSGMLTLVATAPNLVVNAELAGHGLEGFRFFSFTPFGLPLLVFAIIYMVFARRMLAPRRDDFSAARGRPSLQTWIDQYRLADREYRVRVTLKSPLVGKRLEELSLRAAGINIVAIVRSLRLGTQMIRPVAQTELQVDDTLSSTFVSQRSRWRRSVENSCLMPCHSTTTADTSPTCGTRSVWWRLLFITSRRWSTGPDWRPGFGANTG